MRYLCAFIIFAGLTYAYLYPGSRALFEKRTDIVLSDDTDTSSVPLAYDELEQTFKEHPSYLLYGAVYTATPNPEHGVAQWFSWGERWIVVGAARFFPLEQLTTAFSFALMLLSALCMLLLTRYLGWDWWLSTGLA